LRKIAAAALALLVLVPLYGPVVLRRTLAGRLGIGIGVAAIAGILAIGLATPGATVARLPVTVAPLGPGAFAGSIESGHGLREPIRLSFSEAMDVASVAKALTVEPSTALDLAWDAGSRTVTIGATAGWKPGAYYAISISTSALDLTGRKLAEPARAVFTTRSGIGGRIEPTDAAGQHGLPTSSSFRVAYEGPVDVAMAQQAFRIVPAVDGAFESGVTTAGGTTLTFVPLESLAADTDYTISMAGVVRDADGAPTTSPAALTIRTVPAPSVVRFRPLNGSTAAARTAALSIRFTAQMDRASTAAAFSARVGDTKLKGKISWTEGDTVLVFDPAAALDYGAKVVMEVAGSALDQSGTPLGAVRSATFAVEKKPAPRPVRQTSGGSSSGSVHISTGGGSVGSGAWHAVETYYLELMNCTRGGGWVTSDGNCSSPGGSGIAPLVLDAGISDQVSRPYAKLLASRDICSHFVDGNPGDRLHRAGYAGDYRENIGCRAGSPYASVLGTHLFFQAEKPCGGYCHYANIMSRSMKKVGIGVWAYGDRVRLVIDFWEG
jgi:hypothetical protein